MFSDWHRVSVLSSFSVTDTVLDIPTFIGSFSLTQAYCFLLVFAAANTDLLRDHFQWLMQINFFCPLFSVTARGLSLGHFHFNKDLLLISHFHWHTQTYWNLLSFSDRRTPNFHYLISRRCTDLPLLVHFQWQILCVCWFSVTDLDYSYWLHFAIADRPTAIC